MGFNPHRPQKRRPSDIAFVVEELKAVFDPRGGITIPSRICFVLRLTNLTT